MGKCTGEGGTRWDPPKASQSAAMAKCAASCVNCAHARLSICKPFGAKFGGRRSAQLAGVHLGAGQAIINCPRPGQGTAFNAAAPEEGVSSLACRTILPPAGPPAHYFHPFACIQHQAPPRAPLPGLAWPPRPALSSRPAINSRTCCENIGSHPCVPVLIPPHRCPHNHQTHAPWTTRPRPRAWWARAIASCSAWAGSATNTKRRRNSTRRQPTSSSLAKHVSACCLFRGEGDQQGHLTACRRQPTCHPAVAEVLPAMPFSLHVPLPQTPTFNYTNHPEYTSKSTHTNTHNLTTLVPQNTPTHTKNLLTLALTLSPLPPLPPTQGLRRATLTSSWQRSTQNWSPNMTRPRRGWRGPRHIRKWTRRVSAAPGYLPSLKIFRYLPSLKIFR